MNYIVQFSVNIALESAMFLVLGIIIVTCIWQRNVSRTTTPLIFLISFIMLTLVDQVVTNILWLNQIHIKFGLTPVRIAFIFDYLFGYAITVAFYKYVEALVKDGYNNNGIEYKPKKHVIIMIIAWGVVSALIYGIRLFDPVVFSLGDNELIYSISDYIRLQFMTKLAIICTVAVIIKNRKVLSKTEAVLSVIFLVLISGFVIVDELCGLCISYILMSLFVFVLYVRIDLHKGLLLERQEREINEKQTQIMLSQMQPHFIYNVLTTISSMCEMQNAMQARDVVNKFADYFRANLNSLGKEKTISFKKDLEHVQTYLWLEKIRFDDSLNICYNIGPVDFELPSLVVQPMVENAVKHGILPKEDGGTVTISTAESDKEYLITVEDDGVGFDVNAVADDNRTHVGIKNVSKRLELICNGSCDISSEIGKGTVVTIHIPKGE